VGTRNDDISLILAKAKKQGFLPDVSDSEVDILTEEAASIFGNDVPFGASFAAKGENTNNIFTALPNLVKAVRSYNDNSPTTLRFVTIGNSLGLGPHGSVDPTNAISTYFFNKLSAVVNRLGNLTLTNTNGSVGGTTFASATATDYVAAKTTAGGVPTVVPIIFGMNEGTSGQYHRGITYGGVYSFGKNLIDSIRGDGGDPVLFTSPHPHTGRQSWADAGPYTYPASGVMIPDATTAQSIKSVTARNGNSVSASYRHLRVNEAIRQLGADTGTVVIDVEKYWFEAVYAYGEDNLFNIGETVHPNLFAYKKTFYKAIDDFINSITKPSILSTARAAYPVTAIRKNSNTSRTATTALAVDPELSIPIGPNQTWLIQAVVHYTTPTTADIRLGWTTPTGLTGRFDVTAPGISAAGSDSTIVARSGTVIGGNYIDAGGNTTDVVARVTASVVTDSTGTGTFGITWCQNTSDAGNTVVYAGSYLVATRIA
jgi:hypothetical protein